MAAGKAVNSRATLTIRGVVQGVGFRPFVARLAKEHGLTGQVRNEGGQVRVTAYGKAPALRAFAGALEKSAPRASRIVSLDLLLEPLRADEAPPTAFTIAQSEEAEGLAMPTPDIAMCDDCLLELFAQDDPRYRNPFISCTHCGPRFTILRQLPYDRRHTVMDAFPLCGLCDAQYRRPADRRYHAQTVCCNGCGPTLRWRGWGGGAEATGEAALQNAIHALQTGGIVMVKGIGGYHLACDATRADAIDTLRVLKGRESKPFAVMFRTMDALAAHCATDEAERALLQVPERPIVLLKRLATSTIAANVYGTSPRLGAFLPYTPLQALLLANTEPLVMTSANPSGLPILMEDGEALRFAAEREPCVGVLYHDRPILRRVDDSVAMVVNGRTILLRRARGYVPLPLPFSGANSPALLALGAQQKSTVCLSTGGQMYPSTEIGDLDNLETMAVYRDTVRDMQALLVIRPEAAVCDMHPDYESTRFAEQCGLPVLKVQHHFAHIASVLAEAGERGPVIGVAFDGTGYGPDGTVWGGEFLIATATGYTRVAHIKAIPYLGGDASVRQGWKSAACLLHNAGVSCVGDDARSAAVCAALDAGMNAIRSSSMGRVFDGVSSLLGICHDSGYEGQGAIELENAAARVETMATADAFPFDIREEDGGDALVIDLKPCVRALVQGRDTGEARDMLALRFHETVSRMVQRVCRMLRTRWGLCTVALSGGVFQNRILLVRTLALLKADGFEVLTNHDVPPNDGGIALGQAYAARRIWEEKGAYPACV